MCDDGTNIGTTCPLKQSQIKPKIVWDTIIPLGIIFCALGIFYLVLFTPVSSFMQGQVTIDMDQIFHKDNTAIPVTIQLTGPNTGFSVNLSKKSNGSGFIQIDSIPNLQPYLNLTNVTPSDKSIMYGNSLGSGKYNVFINTTDLVEGYYELIATSNFYGKTEVRGFYLLNSSEK